MERLSLRVLAPPAAEIRTVPLPLAENGSACTVHLRCLPGASAIHLSFLDGAGSVVLRAEVDAAGGETVPVQVSLGADREVRVWSPGRRVLTLLPNTQHEPPPPIPAAAPGAGLDLVFVIDGTARHFAMENDVVVSKPLLGQKEIWQEQVELLVWLAEGLSEGVNESRFAVLAFGDEELREIEARELRPLYVLHPPEPRRRFTPWSPAGCREVLSALAPTPGGDFVDALADALQACRRLPWRERTRRIVMVCGDSPGHSVRHPLCQGADLHARRLDVDIEAEHLHRMGIEIATLYLDPPENVKLRGVAYQRELLDGAREQYARLASLSSMAFEISRFDPEAAALEVRGREGLLGRRVAPGELVGLTEP